MHKEDFFCALRAKLSGLPQEDLERSLEFYREAIDDRMEGGLTEEEAVGQLGSVDEIAEQILVETPLPRLIRAKVTPGRSLKAWEILLLVLGSPLWLSLLLAAAAVVLAVYVALWSVLIAVYAVVLAFAAGGIALLLTGIGQLLSMGLGFVLIGLSVLLFFAANAIGKGIVCLSRKCVLWTKALFVKREEAK